MTTSELTPWHPYISRNADGTLHYPIRYTAADNTSLLWSDGEDANSASESIGMDYVYRQPNKLWIQHTQSAADSANKQNDSEANGASQNTVPVVNFVQKLTNTPVSEMPNLFLFPPKIDETIEDIDDDQYVLTQRRLNKKKNLNSDDDSQDRQVDENSDDGTSDKQAEISKESSGSYVTCATNLAGILYTDDTNGDIQLSISSRFSVDENGNPVPLWKDWFFAYMVQQVTHINLLSVDFDHDSGSAWRELLMWMFPTYLNRAMEKGMFHTYVRRKYNDSSPRGRIDIARHIRENTPFLGTVAYSRREYDADNPVTELIRHTVEYIAASGNIGEQILNSDADTVRHVREIRRITPRYNQHDRRSVIDGNIRRPVRHALYQEYRVLQRLCIGILMHRGIDVTRSGRDSVHGILFDCAWLWEEYLNLVLRREGITVIHPQNKADRYRSYLMKEVDTDGKPFGSQLGLIYPDYQLTVGNSSVIADAKYKPVGNIGGRDYSQVIAYMTRFGTMNGLYLHPFIPSKDTKVDPKLPYSKHCYQLLGGNIEESHPQPQKPPRSLYKLGLNVSSKEVLAYHDYVACMHEREQEFAGEIKRIIDPPVTSENATQLEKISI